MAATNIIRHAILCTYANILKKPYPEVDILGQRICNYQSYYKWSKDFTNLPSINRSKISAFKILLLMWAIINF